MNHRLKPWLFALLVLGFLATPRGPAEAKRWEAEKHNVVLEIPDDPYPWDWDPYSSTYEKYNIVKGARRVVEKLRATGKPAAGEGALLHLVVRDALKDETLDKAAINPDVQKFLKDRFTKHGDIEISETDLIGEIPGRILTIDGQSKNLAKKDSPCRGMMVVAVLRKKVYLLRMYAWHTEFDEEGLKGDLDFISADGLSFIATTEIKDPNAAPPQDGEGPGQPGGADSADDGPGPDEIIWLVDEPLRMVRDGRLKKKEMTKREIKNWLILKLEGNHQAGSHQVFMYAIPNDRKVNGVSAGMQDIKKAITTTWYKQFIASHPTGDIFKFGWDKKAPYLTLPQLTDDNRKVLFDGKKKKREVRPSSTEIIKKLDIVQKVKRSRIGDHKPSEAYRGNLQGLQSGVGKVTTLRYAFRGRKYTFRIYVTLARDGYAKFGDAVRKTLESIELFRKLPAHAPKEIADQKAANAELAARAEAAAKKKALAEEDAAKQKAEEEAARAAEEEAAEAEKAGGDEKKADDGKQADDGK